MLSIHRPARLVTWLLPAGALLVALIAASVLASGSPITALVVLGICAVPLLAYAAFKAPLIFPFGLYAATVPIDNLLLISGGLTITRFVGIAALGALLLRILILRRALAPGKAWAAWTAVIAWMAMTAIWSVNPSQTLKTLTMMVSLYATYTVVTMYPARRRELLVLCGMIVLSGVGLAIFAAAQYLSGAMASDSRLQIGDDNFGIDVNHFAANFMLPIALAAMGFLSIRQTALRVALAAATFVMGVGLLLTGSRGGLISFAVLLAYIGIRTRRVRETVFIAAAGLSAGIVLPTVFQRFNDPTQGAASGRFYIWEIAGPALLSGMHWIYGYGLGCFPAVYDHVFLTVFQPTSTGYSRPGHNLIINTSVELGVIGLVLIFFAWFQSYRSADTIPVGTPWFAMRVASEGVVLALFATAMSVDVLWFKYLWLGFMLGPLARNAYAPTSLFGRRSKAAGAVPARRTASNSFSLADLEQTRVAPEI